MRDWSGHRMALMVGAALRVAAFPFAEDLWADAPVRGDIALAWARAPGLWWSYREVAQFGPLPSLLEGLSARVGLGVRVVPLLAGVLGLWLIARVAGRLTGSDGAAFAAWCLALSPLHLQASTTCASEALYLLFALGCIEGLLAGRDALLVLSAFAASTTRFDAWLWLPPLAGLVLWRVRSWRGLRLGALLALGPVSILLANALTLHRPFAPLLHISSEHTVLAARLLTSQGPLLARLRTVLFWPIAPLLVLTPVLGGLALRGLRRPRGEMLDSATIALTPPATYALRAALTGTFLPLLRMAGPPAQLLTTLVQPPSRVLLRWAIAGAVIFDLALLGLASFPGPLQELARVATPVTRLPEDLRAGVRWVQGSAELALDQSAGCEDIVIAHHASRDRFSLYAPRTPPTRIVSIAGAPLDLALEQDGRAFGERCTRRETVGRVSLWVCAR